MKTFYLLRHTNFSNPKNIFHGRLSIPLTEEGREKAQHIAEWFSDKKIVKIYSSPVVRCRETAEIIGTRIRKRAEFDVRLAELLCAIQGMDLDEYKKDRNIRFSLVPSLGGETMRDVQVRMLDFFYEKMKSEKGNCIICSHGDGLYFLYLALVQKEIPADVYDFDRSEYQEMGTVRSVVIDGVKCSVQPIVNPLV